MAFYGKTRKSKHDIILCPFGFPLSPLVCTKCATCRVFSQISGKLHLSLTLAYPCQRYFPHFTDKQKKAMGGTRYSSSERLSVKCQGQLQTKVLSFPNQCFFYHFAYKSQWVLLGRSRTSILFSFYPFLPNFPQVAIKGHSACVRRWKFWPWFYHWRSQTSHLRNSGPHVDQCYDEIKFILWHFMARKEKFKHDIILCLFCFPLSPLAYCVSASQTSLGDIIPS